MKNRNVIVSQIDVVKAGQSDPFGARGYEAELKINIVSSGDFSDLTPYGFAMLAAQTLMSGPISTNIVEKREIENQIAALQAKLQEM